MQYRETTSFREVVRLTFIATLALFFIAETMLAQDDDGRPPCYRRYFRHCRYPVVLGSESLSPG